MKRRIAMWVAAGFLVAGFWAVFALANTSSSAERMREAWPLVSLTCPVAILGKHYAISLYEVLIINALTYSAAGLIVEGLRKYLFHSPRSPRHGLGTLRRG